MAERDKELQLLEKRFAELADRAWQQNLFVFTGFLSLVEQEVLWRSAAKAGVHIELYGGMDGAERCMGRFGDPEEFGYEEPFPICAVKIEPLAEKFAENFSHRDFMGAILNLGIDRSTIGDICVEGKCAYVFCTSAMSVFLQETLEQVRHTKVRCVPVEKLEALPENPGGYALLEAAGRKRGFLLARGEIDTERMARVLLEEFRSCKLGRFTFEMPEESL